MPSAWEKTFQNLRSTREPELIAQGFDIHDVCYWLGNSPKVAIKHYLQVRETSFEKAAATTTNPIDRKQVPPSPRHSIKAVQNPVQQTAADVRNTSHGVKAHADLRANATTNNTVRSKQHPRQESNL